MRQIYKKRRDRLLTALNQELRGWLEPLPSFYGTHVVGLARIPVDVERVAYGLAQTGVKIHTLHRYFIGPRRKTGLVFGYGASDLPEIDRGLSVLREALSTYGPANTEP
jgi:GntR family transcriptional regulator/MocR family aminotransferase